MKHILLSAFLTAIIGSAAAQITVTQADYGQVGDSLLIAIDSSSAGLSVGGTGSQTWTFNTLSIANLNTLKFSDPANAASGSFFPGADIAIERQTDTLFFKSGTSQLSLDGISGDAFGLGASIAANIEPDLVQFTFPSTSGTSYMDTAVIDTTVSGAEFQVPFDSIRIKRVIMVESEIDAFGSLTTPGGTYNTLRQYLREMNTDTAWVLVPFVGWTVFLDSVSTIHNYRWMANGEDWPVLEVQADAAGGNFLSATFKVDDNVLGIVDTKTEPSCNGDCDGSITVSGIGGTGNYTYEWSDGQTTATASALCAGTYTVTIDDGIGTYELTVPLNEPTVISINAVVQGIVFGNDGEIDLTVTGGVSNFTYSWSGPSGFTATTADIIDLDEGVYSVTVTDGNGCTQTGTYEVLPTGINSIEEEGFSVYPNPAQGLITISGLAAGMTNFELVNVAGQAVINGTIENYGVIDLSKLPSGMYSLRVESEEKTMIKPILVHK